MDKHRVTLRVELEPSGSASVQTVQIRASINWVYPGVFAYSEEDPKDRYVQSLLMLQDAYSIALSKALIHGVLVQDEDFKHFGKVLGDWETVFTGENMLFYVLWVRDFAESITGTELVTKAFGKTLEEYASVPDIIAKLISKPFDESVSSADSNVLATNLGKSELIQTYEDKLFDIGLDKSELVLSNDSLDRVVSFIRDYDESVTPQEYVAKHYEKSLDQLSVSLLEAVIVAMLFEKSYEDVVNMNISGDFFNNSLLGEYAVNANIGGEFLEFLTHKMLSTATSPEDLFDRTVEYFRSFEDSFSMYDTADWNNGDGLIYDFGDYEQDFPEVSDQLASVVSFIRDYADNQSVEDAYISNFGKSLSDTLGEPADVYDRVVSYFRDYADSFGTTENIQFDFSKVLSDSMSVIDQIIVGLLFQKTYFDNVYTEVRGESLNSFALGENYLNATIGGEFVSLGAIKPISESVVGSDSYDRVVVWNPVYTESQSAQDSIDQKQFSKVSGDSATPSDTANSVNQFSRGFSDSQSASESSMSAVVVQSMSISATLNSATVGSLPINQPGSVTTVNNYTFI